MTVNSIEIIILVLTGVGIGIFVSIASGTAATLLIPILTVFFNYSSHKSVGTSLALDTIIGGTAALIYMRHRIIVTRSLIALISFGIIGSILGSQYTGETSEYGLKLIIGFLLLIIGSNFAWNGTRSKINLTKKHQIFDLVTHHKILTSILLGTIVGFLSGFVGLGSGRIMSLILIFIVGYSFHSAVGTSLLIMFFIAGTGAVFHGVRNEFILGVLGIMIPSVFFGTIIGSMYANKIDEKKMIRTVGIIIFIFGLILLLNGISQIYFDGI